MHMNLNTDHYARCIRTLEASLVHLEKAEAESSEFEIFRNAVVKGFELTLLPLFVADARVLAYGSRVTGASHEGSDLDLIACNPHDRSSSLPGVTALREAFSQSDLPILIDVLNWARIPESFRQEITGSETVTVYPLSYSNYPGVIPCLNEEHD